MCRSHLLPQRLSDMDPTMMIGVRGTIVVAHQSNFPSQKPHFYFRSFISSYLRYTAICPLPYRASLLVDYQLPRNINVGAHNLRHKPSNLRLYCTHLLRPKLNLC